jgi:hypothetical protein
VKKEPKKCKLKARIQAMVNGSIAIVDAEAITEPSQRGQARDYWRYPWTLGWKWCGEYWIRLLRSWLDPKGFIRKTGARIDMAKKKPRGHGQTVYVHRTAPGCSVDNVGLRISNAVGL